MSADGEPPVGGRAEGTGTPGPVVGTGTRGPAEGAHPGGPLPPSAQRTATTAAPSTRGRVAPADRPRAAGGASRVLGVLARPLGAGRRTPDERSTTARDLALRHRLLLALSALLTLSLFLSYEGVHGDANPLRTASAPAVLSIDTALYALGQAEDVPVSSAVSVSSRMRRVYGSRVCRSRASSVHS
ncbi:hypothetical protein ACWEN3_40980, partial [Streptomyces sp. NPDC004561]